MSKPIYVKDPITGAVIFHDENAYANRKKVLQQQKEKNVLFWERKTHLQLKFHFRVKGIS